MRSVFFLLAIMISIAFLWRSTLLLPLKLLVVFFHETSHALATLLSGGVVKSLVVSAEQGGQVISMGGNRFMILSAGYLGSLIWGLLLFLITVLTDRDRLITAFLGLTMMLITLLYADTLFTRLFGAVLGLSFGLSAVYFSNFINDLICRVVALTNMLYVPLDIVDDTLLRHHLRSDAAMMAEHYGGHTLLWGGLWLFLSCIMIIICLKIAIKIETKKHKQSKLIDN